MGKVESKARNVSFLPDRITGYFYTVGADGNNLLKFVMYEGWGELSGVTFLRRFWEWENV